MSERRPLLRRAAYLAAVTTTVGVFAGSLAGIASTQGQAKPNGDAAALVEYLLSEDGQSYFAEETGEYPLVEGVEQPAGFPELSEVKAPDVDLNDLDDLQTTIQMIQEAGLL